MKDFFFNIYHKLKRTWDWHHNVLKNDCDFDSHSIFNMLEFKLKRLKRDLVNGWAIHTSTELKSLDLAIKLAGRLKEDNYDARGYEKHEAKWGNLKTWMIPLENGNFQYHSSRPRATTGEEKEQMRKELLAMSHAAFNSMQREKRWFYSILTKYQDSWWD